LSSSFRACLDEQNSNTHECETRGIIPLFANEIRFSEGKRRKIDGENAVMLYYFSKIFVRNFLVLVTGEEVVPGERYAFLRDDGGTCIRSEYR
jgi:hypothetical protein